MVEKTPFVKKMKKYFFVLNKNESVSVSIFQELFRNIVYRYVAFVTILDLFSKDRTFSTLYPTLCIQKEFTKNPLNFYSLKVTKFQDDNVKNESPRGGRPAPQTISLNTVV